MNNDTIRGLDNTMREGHCNCRVCWCQHTASDYVCGDCEVGRHSGQPKRGNFEKRMEERKKNGFFLGAKQVYDNLSGQIRSDIIV